MTVGELKKKLEQYDENLPVYVNNKSENGTDEAEEVYIDKPCPSCKKKAVLIEVET